MGNTVRKVWFVELFVVEVGDPPFPLVYGYAMRARGDASAWRGEARSVELDGETRKVVTVLSANLNETDIDALVEMLGREEVVIVRETGATKGPCLIRGGLVARARVLRPGTGTRVDPYDSPFGYSVWSSELWNTDKTGLVDDIARRLRALNGPADGHDVAWPDRRDARRLLHWVERECAETLTGRATHRLGNFESFESLAEPPGSIFSSAPLRENEKLDGRDGVRLTISEAVLTRLGFVIAWVEFRHKDAVVSRETRQFRGGEALVQHVLAPAGALVSAVSVSLHDGRSGALLDSEDYHVVEGIGMVASVVRERVLVRDGLSDRLAARERHKGYAASAELDSVVRVSSQRSEVGPGPQAVNWGRIQQDAVKAARWMGDHPSDEVGLWLPRESTEQEVHGFKRIVALFDRPSVARAILADPWLDAASIFAIASRVANAEPHVVFLTAAFAEKPEVWDATRSALTNATRQIHGNMEVLRAERFHDRYLLVDEHETASVYALTNSFVNAGQAHPIAVIPVHGVVSLEIAAYVSRLLESARTGGQPTWSTRGVPAVAAIAHGDDWEDERARWRRIAALPARDAIRQALEEVDPKRARARKFWWQLQQFVAVVGQHAANPDSEMRTLVTVWKQKAWSVAGMSDGGVMTALELLRAEGVEAVIGEAQRVLADAAQEVAKIAADAPDFGAMRRVVAAAELIGGLLQRDDDDLALALRSCSTSLLRDVGLGLTFAAAERELDPRAALAALDRAGLAAEEKAWVLAWALREWREGREDARPVFVAGAGTTLAQVADQDIVRRVLEHVWRDQKAPELILEIQRAMPIRSPASSTADRVLIDRTEQLLPRKDGTLDIHVLSQTPPSDVHRLATAAAEAVVRGGPGGVSEHAQRVRKALADTTRALSHPRLRHAKSDRYYYLVLHGVWTAAYGLRILAAARAAEVAVPDRLAGTVFQSLLDYRLLDDGVTLGDFPSARVLVADLLGAWMDLAEDGFAPAIDAASAASATVARWGLATDAITPVTIPPYVADASLRFVIHGHRFDQAPFEVLAARMGAATVPWFVDWLARRFEVEPGMVRERLAVQNAVPTPDLG